MSPLEPFDKRLSRLEIIVKPPTKRASEEVKKMLRCVEYEALFVKLPRSLEPLITDFMLSKDYEAFLEGIERSQDVPEPKRSLIIGLESVLRELPYIAADKYVFCYGSASGLREGNELAVKVALLTLHDSIRGDVSVEKWRRLLEEELSHSSRTIEEEAEYISEELANYASGVCITGFEGRHLKEALKRYAETILRYAGNPYHFTPLEVLRRKMQLGDVSDEEVEALAKQHIKYVKQLLIPKGLEEATEEWTRRALYWLGR